MIRVGQQALGLPGFSSADEVSTPDDVEPASDPIASALTLARGRWQREEADRLARAKTEWVTKSEKRLAVSRIGAQRAESALEQLRRRLEKVEDNLAARTFELAEARIAIEQERVRWSESPIAAQAKKAARDLQFQRRIKIAVNLTRDFAWGALVVALAVVAADRAVPVASGVWKHETGSQSVIKPLLRQAGIDIDRLPHAKIVLAAKLRVHPSSTARPSGSLSRGAQVTLLGRRGKWMLVRSADDVEQGWIQVSALEDSSP
jgi:hypothetical protein